MANSENNKCWDRIFDDFLSKKESLLPVESQKKIEEWRKAQRNRGLPPDIKEHKSKWSK